MEYTPEQTQDYNALRNLGYDPQKARELAGIEESNMQEKSLNDTLIDDDPTLGGAIVDGLKEVTVGTFQDFKQQFKDNGIQQTINRIPLTLAAGAGRGVGEVVGGVLETADDLTGERISSALLPVAQDVVNSKFGQNFAKGYNFVDGVSNGVVSDLLEASELLIGPGIVKGAGVRGLKTAAKTAIPNAPKEFVPIENYSKGEAGKFWGPKDSGYTDYGDVKTTGFVDKSKIFYPEESDSFMFLQNKGLLDTPSEQAAKYGDYKTLREMFDDDESKAFDNFKEDPNLFFKALQDSVEDVVDKDKYSGIYWAYEDDLSPQQFQIWDKKVITNKPEADIPEAPKNLEDFFPAESFSDTLFEAGVNALNNVRKAPEAIATKAKKVNDNRIVRTAVTDPVKAETAIVDLYKRAIVPGVKKKKKTINNIQQIEDAVKRSIPALAKKVDDSGNYIYEVDDLTDFAQTISAEKKVIFADIEKGLVDSGAKGRMVSTEQIVKELDELLKSERASVSSDLRRAIQTAKQEFVVDADGVISYKEVSPSGAQDVIADLNAQLDSFYRGSTSGTAADVLVKNIVANNLRKSVDDIVDDLGDGSFKELKSRYGDLKKMEDDVVHRAVFESQKGGGLADMTDIFSAGDVLAGSLDPAFLARGVGQFMSKEIIKSLNDKDELVRQMFLYGRNLNAAEIQ